MIKIPKTKKQRIAHYRKLIDNERKFDYQPGICVALGTLCGSYLGVPWNNWKQLVLYYPELDVYKAPRSLCFSKVRRKKIIESLALRINKKKDIYKNSVIFK